MTFSTLLNVLVTFHAVEVTVKTGVNTNNRNGKGVVISVNGLVYVILSNYLHILQ